MVTTPAARAARARMPRSILAATVIGNFTEWFDFAVYGSVAVTLGAAFFPSHDPAVSLLSSLGVFGIAFFFRPIGGAILGAIGDRYGRRAALAIAVTGISLATTCIGILPSYAAIGVWAPILLVLLRGIQGLSAGGEWTSASAFLAEYAPTNRRATWVSLVSVSAAVAIICGNLLVLGLEDLFGSAAMQSWGWRVPFLLAAPLGVVGLYMRLKLNETPVYREMAKTESQHSTPLASAFRTQKANMVLAFFCSSIMGVGLYYFATYFVNALSLAGALTRPTILTVSAAALLIYAVLCPVAGWISDNIGRRPVYLAGCIGHLVLAVPIFKLVTSGDTGAALLGLAIFAIPQAALNVMGSITLVELFPPHNRSTGAAIGYGLGVGPIAGSAPLIATALVEHTGNPMVAAYYLMGIALVVTLVLVARLPETFTRSLFATTPAGGTVDERGTEPTSDEAAMA